MSYCYVIPHNFPPNNKSFFKIESNKRNKDEFNYYYDIMLLIFVDNKSQNNCFFDIKTQKEKCFFLKCQLIPYIYLTNFERISHNYLQISHVNNRQSLCISIHYVKYRV